MKKAVFYIQGFDPRGEKFYKRTFRNESKKFSEYTGIETVINSKKKSCFTIDAKDVSTELYFLDWQEIISRIYYAKKWKFWLTSFLGLLVWVINPISIKNSNSFLKGFVLMLFSEILLSLAILSILLTLLIKAEFMLFSIFMLLSFFIIKTYFILRNKLSNGKIKHWVQCTISMVGYSMMYKKMFDKCAIKHRNFIENVIEDNNYEEILIISHSGGAFPLLFLINKISQELASKIKIITMGCCIPSYINSYHFKEVKRNCLKLLNEYNLKWFDLYSPLDVISIKLDTDKDFNDAGLISHNSQFYKMYNEKSYATLKTNFFLIHFQYIISGEKPYNMLNFYHLLTTNKKIENYERFTTD